MTITIRCNPIQHEGNEIGEPEFSLFEKVLLIKAGLPREEWREYTVTGVEAYCPKFREGRPTSEPEWHYGIRHDGHIGSALWVEEGAICRPYEVHEEEEVF